MTGGGTVTIKNVGGTIRVRWDTRILALPLMGHASSPFYVIECPAAGAALGAGTVDADGINIGTNDASITGYGSLWYVLPTTSPFTSQPGQFRVVAFQSTTETPAPNWVLICVAFTDAGQQVIRWQAGSVVLPIPTTGQHIQWRATLSLSLSSTGVVNIPNSLTVASVAVERIPWISAYVEASGVVLNNRGQKLATCSKGTPTQITGEYNIFWQQFNHPDVMNYIVHVTPAFGEAFIYVSNRQSNQVRILASTRAGSPVDNAFFITIY